MRVQVLICLLVLGVCNARNGFGPNEQEWDFEEVRPGAHMFWWLHYTTADVQHFEEKPLVIWLQGGPGASGTGYGNFMEFGPFDLDQQPRNFTWVKEYNVLFIDNPVGAGFSHVLNDTLLSTNNTQIAWDLVKCLSGFYEKMEQFRNTPLYIAGESYGGKYIVEFALELYKAMEKKTIESNFKGVVVIDSWISPIDSVMHYADFILANGLADFEGAKEVQLLGDKVVASIKKNDYETALIQCNEQMGKIRELVGNIDVFNILTKLPPYTGDDSMPRAQDLYDLMNGPVKTALEISDVVQWSDVNQNVYDALRHDNMRSVTHIIEEVLDTTPIKVFVVTGQHDLIVSTPGTLSWVTKLKYNDKTNWDKSKRTPLVINNVIEGYFKKHGNFAFYWVDRTGHMVPRENPIAMDEILHQLMA